MLLHQINWFMRYLYFYAVLLLISASGCLTTTSSFYGPGAMSAPLLYRKNQVAITATVGQGAGESSTSNMTDVSVAYSPISRLGLVASYHDFNSSFSDTKNGKTPDNKLTNESKGGEFAAGYYGCTGGSIKYIADIYAGYGRGTLTSTGFMNGDMQFYHFYLQPGIGLKGKVCELALDFRLSDVAFDYKDPMEAFNIVKINAFEAPPINGRKTFFLESALTGRLGYKFLKFQGQVMLINSHADWSYDEVMVSAGIHFSLEYLYSGYFFSAKNK